MNISEIEKQVEGIRSAGGGPTRGEVEGVAIDSREVEPGDLFVALEGAETDGHVYVEEAVGSGAVAVLVEEDRTGAFDVDAPVLTAENTRRVLGPVAAVVYEHPTRDLELIGVTGTNGKTTTAVLLAAILEAQGREVGLIGTLGYRWGDETIDGPNTTPESAILQKLFARMRSDGVETVVMEVSSHGIATHRLRGTLFDGGIFTNFSRDHLDFHGDLESYRAVKRSFFVDHLVRSAEVKSPTAVLNRGDSTGRNFERALEACEEVETVTFAVGDREADLRVDILDRSLDGTELGLEVSEGSFTVRTPLLGEFNAENVAAAVAMATCRGVDTRDLLPALEDLPPVSGRLERVDVESAFGAPAVFVDYAHSPDALDRVLATLAPLTPGRLVVVFGCGGDRDREKRPRMGRVAAERADLVVVTSDNPRSESPEVIIEEILDGISIERAPWSRFEAASRGLWVEPERERAIRTTVQNAWDEDVVLIAGKGHEAYQEGAEGRRPFDDVRRARRALERRR